MIMPPRKILSWIFFGVAAAGLCGAVYVAVQQDMRQSANDPQIQMAEDASLRLASRERPDAVLPSNHIDMSVSIAPFVIVFDGTGRPITSSGMLGNQIPVPPHGVFDYVRTHGEDRVTWQPRDDTRIAAVITAYAGTAGVAGAAPGFVLAGRSLREVEKRESMLTFQMGAAWIFILIMMLLGFLLSRRK
jgi:hypothetical protein